MKVYHYTHWYHLAAIFNQQETRNGFWMPSGLVPQYYTETPYHVGRACALLEPLPRSWIDNPLFPFAWEDIKGHIGKILLEVDVAAEDESIFVADRGHFNLPADQEKISQKYLHLTRREADEAFYAGRVSLTKYLQEIQENKDFFLLPEVNITQRVLRDRLSICTQQPLLMEDLSGKDEASRTKEVKKLISTPELCVWLENHMPQNNSVESSTRKKETL